MFRHRPKTLKENKTKKMVRHSSRCGRGFSSELLGRDGPAATSTRELTRHLWSWERGRRGEGADDDEEDEENWAL